MAKKTPMMQGVESELGQRLEDYLPRSHHKEGHVECRGRSRCEQGDARLLAAEVADSCRADRPGTQ